MEKEGKQTESESKAVPADRNASAAMDNSNAEYSQEAMKHTKGMLVKGCRCCFPPDTMFEVSVCHELRVSFQLDLFVFRQTSLLYSNAGND
jgi:hypothetical protein